MNINSMISVKDAAALLGCDKKYVREKLDQGLFKGEKRLDGEKEKWFVQRKDVEAELSRLPIITPKGTYAPKSKTEAPQAEPTEQSSAPRRRRRAADKTTVESTTVESTTVEPATVEQLNTPKLISDNDLFFGIEAELIDVRPIDEETIAIVEAALARALRAQSKHTEERLAVEQLMLSQSETPSEETDFYKKAVEDVVHEAWRERASQAEVHDHTKKQSFMSVVNTMAREFARRIEDHRAINKGLVEELAEKNMQLRLLPDLQKRADEVYRLEFEAVALRRQIACMEQEQFNIIVALERAEHEAIPQLEARLEEEYRMHSIEVARLCDQINSYAQRAQFDENNLKTIADLESAMFELIEQKDREKRASQAEIDRLKQERAEEVSKANREREIERNRLSAQVAQVKEESEQELAKLAYVTAKFQKEKDFEVALLTDEVDLITQERNIALAKLNDRLAQIAMQGQEIERLEGELRDTTEAKQAQSLASQIEAQRVAIEMTGEITVLNDRITNLQQQLETSRMPWWRKWFLPA